MKCKKCGYTAVTLDMKASCPMCMLCTQCGNKVIDCTCKEP